MTKKTDEERTDEEIYGSYIAGQETRSKDNLLKMMAAVREAERKKHKTELKKRVKSIIQKIVNCKNKDYIDLDFCNIYRNIDLDVGLLLFIKDFFDLVPSEFEEMKSCPLNEEKKP